jgi:hypothetical protein
LSVFSKPIRTRPKNLDLSTIEGMKSAEGNDKFFLQFTQKNRIFLNFFFFVRLNLSQNEKHRPFFTAILLIPNP